MNELTAVVTGGNRGIGLEVVRQLAADGATVYLGARSEDAGRAAADGVTGDVRALALDVTDDASVQAAADRVAGEAGQVDVLVNNAGILHDSKRRATSPDFDIVQSTLDTNLLGAWRVAVAFLPLLRRSDHPRIVNVSSGLGSMTDMSGSVPGYRMSKVALNALTKMLSAELAGEGVKVNSVCPGWVATEMGGPGGRSIEDGAASVLWAARLEDDGPTGGFFRDGRPIDW